YSTAYGVDLDVSPPLPSTLRGLIIHSAKDQSSDADWFSNPDAGVRAWSGPDFATGWGLVNAAGAARLVQNHQILESVIEKDCSKERFAFAMVRKGARPLSFRVTLAWDDYPAEASDGPTTLPRLRNDLDLVLIDPAGNRHYPWQLNQNIKSADGSRLLNPEEQTCDTDITIETQLAPPGPLNAASILPAVKAPDHLNNVEVVDAPRMTGTWMAEVTGFRVPWGPQKF